MIDLRNVVCCFKSRKASKWLMCVLACQWLSVFSMENQYRHSLLFDNPIHTSPSTFPRSAKADDPAASWIKDSHSTNFHDTKTLALPIGTSHGLEYRVTENYAFDDMVSVSILSRYNLTPEDENNRYSFVRPFIFRITLKGYSLFKSERGDPQYFTFDRAKEKEIRSPQFLVSITKHF